MVIHKNNLDRSLRRIRGFHRDHVQGNLDPSAFAQKARSELHCLYIEYTRSLIEATAASVVEELRTLQAQFALDLVCDLHWYQVARGYRGLRAGIYVRSEGSRFRSLEIHVGPFDDWSKIAVHTAKELEGDGRARSFYIKRMRNRWERVSEFDFPALLQRIREESERPEPEEPEEEDEIPF